MEYEKLEVCGDKPIIKTLRNGMLVEFISGNLAEQFKVIDRHLEEPSVSYKESHKTKWGAIGIIKNTYDGVPQTLLIKYRIKIVWNNGKLANHIVGANENNIGRLPLEHEKEWIELINKKIDEHKAEGEVNE